MQKSRQKSWGVNKVYYGNGETANGIFTRKDKDDTMHDDWFIIQSKRRQITENISIVLGCGIGIFRAILNNAVPSSIYSLSFKTSKIWNLTGNRLLTLMDSIRPLQTATNVLFAFRCFESRFRQFVAIDSVRTAL